MKAAAVLPKSVFQRLSSIKNQQQNNPFLPEIIARSSLVKRPREDGLKSSFEGLSKSKQMEADPNQVWLPSATFFARLHGRSPQFILHAAADSKMPPPTYHTFENIIESLLHNDRPDMAIYWMNKMHQYGLSPQIYLFESVIKKLSRFSRHHQAMDLYYRMKEYNCINTSIGLDNVIIRNMISVGFSDQAEECSNILLKQKELEKETLEALIEYFSSEGSLQKMKHWILQTELNFPEMWSKAYVPIINFYYRARDINEMEKWFEVICGTTEVIGMFMAYYMEKEDKQMMIHYYEMGRHNTSLAYLIEASSTEGEAMEWLSKRKKSQEKPGDIDDELRMAMTRFYARTKLSDKMIGWFESLRRKNNRGLLLKPLLEHYSRKGATRMMIQTWMKIEREQQEVRGEPKTDTGAYLFNTPADVIRECFNVLLEHFWRHKMTKEWPLRILLMMKERNITANRKTALLLEKINAGDK
ncbi:hypothetical protein PROFUN_05548 [Planoprotostelium fungivorum]|uniref:Pentatricopeptide repeat-containing protein n=1 Tax=Planoprotostelium fungivorum TaxID=1890364 RepID=A0A2P6N038_9EUKA|nr:hypothetical protein PROFUN_05548 [Planoprotostelium fungivorum]